MILFDFGGTLDADGRWWCVRFHDAYRGEGGRLELAAFAPRFAASDRAMYAAPGVRGLGFRQMAVLQATLLRGLLPTEHIDWGRVAERFVAESVDTVDRNRPLLRALCERFRLGIVSNFTGNLLLCLTELGILSFFDAVADSTVVGIAKPDPRIFMEALRAADGEAAGSWMVGDNFENDIRPARALGLRGCWLADRTRPAPTDCVPDARIERLPELAELLLSEEVTCTA